jgi:UDP-N-acetylglucosamine--N-acetylmuramyl-(pentapeptide) pyrophosphoryl-undecaprenol N-acetylglucosamine transferase
MKVLAVGGGSGGHVTPVVAVLREIKARQPKAEIRFWCDKKFSKQAKSLLADFDSGVRVDTISSGKLRRYYHLSIIRQLFWAKLVMLNLRDSLFVVAGFFQSLAKLIIWRPDVVFTKGGYVCLPVGMAAKLLGIPLVIHDSDAHPGLTNRILAKWANAIATGAPLEYYNYPKAISRYVGIPISSDFHKFSDIERLDAKKQWGIKPDSKLIVVTGGGLGAKRINDAIAEVLDDLLGLGSVILVAGAAQYDELRAITPEFDARFQLHSFVSKGMAQLLGAADVVLTRAGATTILELAALECPTILIPNAKLTGGHQLKNAAVYAEAGAVVILDEQTMVDNPKSIVTTVTDIIDNNDKTAIMTKKFSKFARPTAAKDMADMILTASK